MKLFFFKPRAAEPADIEALDQVLARFAGDYVNSELSWATRDVSARSLTAEQFKRLVDTVTQNVLDRVDWCGLAVHQSHKQERLACTVENRPLSDRQYERREAPLRALAAARVRQMSSRAMVMHFC